MTEAEWLACEDPEPMLRHLRATGVPRRNGGRRKLRLFGCACVRRKWKRATDPRSRALVVAAERYADGLAEADELATAELAALEAREEEAKGLVVVGAGVQLPPWCLHTIAELSDHEHPQPAWGFALAATLMPRVVQATAAHGPEDRAQAALVRDIFGNPLRPVTFSPSWHTVTAVAIARQTYDSRDFSAMPILADALQDAGCDNEDILDHCRGDGPHVRGCWVVDLVLGKE
jgi:hypothetical protein